jgi:hypothetical protein
LFTMSGAEARAGALRVLMMDVTVRWTKLGGWQSFTMSSAEARAGTLRVFVMEATVRWTVSRVGNRYSG